MSESPNDSIRESVRVDHSILGADYGRGGTSFGHFTRLPAEMSFSGPCYGEVYDIVVGCKAGDRLWVEVDGVRFDGCELVSLHIDTKVEDGDPSRIFCAVVRVPPIERPTIIDARPTQMVDLYIAD